MAAIWVNLQLHHQGAFVSDPELRYANAVTYPQVLTADVDETNIIKFNRWANLIGYLKVEKFACRINKRGVYHFLSTDADILNFVPYLKHKDHVDVYVVHTIEGSPTGPTTGLLEGPIEPTGVDPNVEPTGVDPNVEPTVEPTVEPSGEPSVEHSGEHSGEPSVEHSGQHSGEHSGQPSGEPSDLNTSERERVGDKGKQPAEPTSEGEGENLYDFSSYHLQTSDSEDLDYNEESSDESMYGSDEDVSDDETDLEEEFTAARKAKIKDKINKKKSALDNLDEIPTGPVGIDDGFEDMYKDKKRRYEGKLGGDEPYFDSSDPGSEVSDEDDLVGEDEVVSVKPRKESSKLYFDPTAKKVLFQLDMIFVNAIQFRDALQTYAIQKGVHVKLRPNERHRVRAKCMREKCPWHILGSIEGSTGNFIVKTYYPAHSCSRLTKNKSCNAAWIAKKYKDLIIKVPQIKLREIQALLQKKYSLYVNKSACARAKMMILKEHMGDYKLEFSRLYDYADMIRRTNPGSTVVIKTSKETQPGKEVFMGIYVCLHALKTGWLEGCRNIIGFDGAFLKGVCKGKILACISKDGNNQMYPVAWAVIDKETKNTWSWFLRCLMHDLNLTEIEERLTIMSDMQKGLVEAVKLLLPNAEHRMCARHMWSNWKQNWRGEERRRQFWKCARASFEVGFSDQMDELDKLGDQICEGLLTYNKDYWVRAYFREYSKCDVVENNMCETFNSWIVEARHKTIITMLEEIRHKMMDRMQKMREFAAKWPDDISPMAQDLLSKNAQAAMNCSVVFNRDSGFEVIDDPYQHEVCIRKRTCTCRSWQLKGIPCAHAISAMHSRDLDPKQFVEHWYWKDTYLMGFTNFIQPITNIKMWPASTNPSIEPPVVTRMPGRPKKNRRKAPDEPKKKFGKRSRKGTPMTCSNCKRTAGGTTVGTGVSAPTNTSQPSQSTCETAAAKSRRNQPKKRASTSVGGTSDPSTQQSRVTSEIAAAPGPSQPSQSNNANIAAGGTRRNQPNNKGGENSGNKRQKTAGFGVLFGKRGVVIQRSGLSDRIVHNPSKIKSAAATNIGLRFRPPGLKWKGRDAITGSQLQQQRDATRSKTSATTQASGEI